ncbi:glycine zipper 2TM domain-containing protein [Halomonas flagellata]|uniref:glycine zipper 2TM domain-containing protein n=1 Tax=Halomonas flagellata TaxID=2920385 RepID=UPI0023E864E7|nr:glycine zipper 2TM domain-containing protein [Halomonas flagellata]
MAASIRGILRRLSVVLLGLFLLGGCQTTSTGEGVGTGLGALIGAGLGSQVGSGSGRTAAMLIGAGLGAWLGREIGIRLTREDQRAMSAALDRTPDGTSEKWRNPQTGNEFTMTPRETFERGDQQCRHFEMQVVVDGEPRRTDGTACRRPDDQEWSTV